MKLYEIAHPDTGLVYPLIYIDIERRIDGHLFMFGLDRGTGYERFIVDRNLRPAAERYNAYIIDEDYILQEIFRDQKPTIIVGYTATEFEWIRSLASRYSFSIPNNSMYIDAKKGAQKWASSEHRGELRNLPPLSPTRHRLNRPSMKSLVSMVRLIEVHPPCDYGYGITSGRFGYVAERLASCKSFEKLSRVAKVKLTRAMKHNKFDVETMVQLFGLVSQQRPSVLFNEGANVMFSR
jgi:hypothetical protein